MSSPRRPVRLLDKNDATATKYPKELVADFENDNLYLVKDDGTEAEVVKLVEEIVGEGNVVSSVKIEGKKITITKGSALTSHPIIVKDTDTSDAATPGSGGKFNVVDSVTRDGNGHVLKVNTKEITMPTVPTTAAQVGAAPASHTHTAADVGAAAANHSHTPASIGAATSNHTHTAAQVGAAAASHTHAGMATHALYNATIGTAWSGSAAPFTQNISISGILAADTPIVDMNLSSITYANKEKVVEAYSKIYRITTYANGITVYSDEKTTVNIPIQLKVIR